MRVLSVFERVRFPYGLFLHIAESLYLCGFWKVSYSEQKPYPIKNPIKSNQRFLKGGTLPHLCNLEMPHVRTDKVLFFCLKKECTRVHSNHHIGLFHVSVYGFIKRSFLMLSHTDVLFPKNGHCMKCNRQMLQSGHRLDRLSNFQILCRTIR